MRGQVVVFHFDLLSRGMYMELIPLPDERCSPRILLPCDVLECHSRCWSESRNDLMRFHVGAKLMTMVVFGLPLKMAISILLLI